MKALKTLLVAVALLLVSAPLSAQANLIWDWTGDCNGIVTPAPGGGVNGCAGQATLHVVTTDNYIPGTVFPWNPATRTALVEFLYSDMNVSVDLFPYWFFDGNDFQLPASLSGGGHLLAIAGDFSSNPNGVWNFGAEGARPNCDPGIDFICGYEARGFNGVWTRVAVPTPEPATLVLLGMGLVGLVGLVLVRRRNQ